MGDNPPLCYSCSSQIWAWLVAGVGQPPRPREGCSTMHSSMPPVPLPPCPPFLSWSLQAGRWSAMGFARVTAFFSAFMGFVLKVTWSLPSPSSQENSPVNLKGSSSLLSSPAKSMLSHSLFLFHSKLFSSTLGELTLLVNRVVTYFWLHLEIKCHLSYSV